jgi:hypothetical protein
MLSFRRRNLLGPTPKEPDVSIDPKILLDKAMAAAINNPGNSLALLSAQIALPKPVRKQNPGEPTHREFFSIGELAERWRCSRGTVYNRLRTAGVKLLDWADRGKKGKKVIRAADVYQIENSRMKRLA